MCSIHSAAGEPPWPGWLGAARAEALGQPLLEREPAPAAAGAVQEEQRRARAVAQQVDGRVADGDPVGLGHGVVLPRQPAVQRHQSVTADHGRGADGCRRPGAGADAEAPRYGADQEGAERRHPGEHQRVQAHDAAAQLVGHRELHASCWRRS